MLNLMNTCKIRHYEYGQSRLTRTMVKDGRCRWAGYFLLSPTLLGLGSGRFLCRCVTSCLGLLVFLARFATSLLASAAVIEVAAVAALAGLLILTTFTALILLVLLNVPHRSGTGWTPKVNKQKRRSYKQTIRVPTTRQKYHAEKYIY